MEQVHKELEESISRKQILIKFILNKKYKLINNIFNYLINFSIFKIEFSN